VGAVDAAPIKLVIAAHTRVELDGNSEVGKKDRDKLLLAERTLHLGGLAWLLRAGGHPGRRRGRLRSAAAARWLWLGERRRRWCRSRSDGVHVCWRREDGALRAVGRPAAIGVVAIVVRGPRGCANRCVSRLVVGNVVFVGALSLDEQSLRLVTMPEIRVLSIVLNWQKALKKAAHEEAPERLAVGIALHGTLLGTAADRKRGVRRWRWGGEIAQHGGMV